jgi:hypothetical protein
MSMTAAHRGPKVRAAPALLRRPRSTLFWVVVISVSLHVLAGALIGSWTIYRYTRPPEATFESPPPAVRVPLAAVEYRVQMQQMQKQSARPQNQLGAQREALLQQDIRSVVANASAITVPALGGGPVVGGGSGRGGRIGASGIGFGVSAVDFFGIKKQGERVVFIVDAGASMVAPERGDLPGYDRVKTELAAMIHALSPGTMFNIIVFERAVDAFAPAPVVATPDNTQRVAEWIAPYWRLKHAKLEQRGTFRKNYQPKMVDWPDDGGASRLDLALIAALEMTPDLIFIITDGTPSVQRGRNATDDAKWRQALERYKVERAAYEASPKGQAEMAAYDKQRLAWQARQDQINTERKQRGLPPVVREGGTAGAPVRPGPREPRQPTTYYTTDELIRYVRNRARELYRTTTGELPSVNIVGYSADKRGEEFITALARAFPQSTARNIGRFDAKTQY